MKLTALSLLLISVVCADDEYERDIRQTPVFFQNGLQRSHPGQQQPHGQQHKSQLLVPKFVGFGGAPPQGFRPAPQVDEEEEDEIEQNSIAPSPATQQQLLHFRQPQASPQQALQYRPTSPLPPIQPAVAAQVLQPQQTLALKNRPSQNQPEFQLRRPQPIKNQLVPQALSEEELEEKEEPDRLTELLPQSKFNCNGKKTGYYADDGLNCEVFHYCQDNARHSWICPEGFSFHQVHLICMPPSSDNICQQSSQFHFVNDFLYRPINAEEAQSRPNVSIRYADRYYPENYYESGGEEDAGGEHVRTFQQRQPPPPPPPRDQAASRPRPTPQPFPSTLRPLAQLPQQFTRQYNQVYHSPEEVNIPLQSRRATPTARAPPQREQNFEFENQ